MHGWALALINTAMGIYGPHFCKGLIDAVWCDNVGSQTHSNSANMLYSIQYTYTKEDMLCLFLLVFGFCMNDINFFCGHLKFHRGQY